MGFPSLLEEIVQKRLDNFFSALPSARIYTSDDFKKALVALGLTARNLLKLSDEDLVEISESFAKDAKNAEDNLKKARKELEISKNNIIKLANEIQSKDKLINDIQKVIINKSNEINKLNEKIRNIEINKTNEIRTFEEKIFPFIPLTHV